MKVVTSPESLPVTGYLVYLAGAIDMGEAPNWQKQVIEALSDVPNLVIVNPRRAAFTPDMEEEQIRWELDAMEACHQILMWLPKDTQAPVSFLEFGLYLRSGKLIVGVEEGFYRQRNIEITAERFDIPVYRAFVEVIEQVRLNIPKESKG